MKKKRHSDMVAYYLWGKCLFIFMLSISLGIIDTQSEIIIIDAGGDRIIPPPDGPGDPPDDGLCYVLNDDGDWVEKNPGNPPDDEQNYVLDDNCDWVVEDPEDDAPDDPGVGAPGDPGAGGPGGGGGNPYMSTMSTMSTKNDDDPCPDPCEKWNSYHEDCFPIEPGDPPGDGPCWEWDDDCKWVPIVPGDPPDDGLCYVLDDECEWEEVDPGKQPDDGLCYILNDECDWEEVDPGDQPGDGLCYELDDECEWVDMFPDERAEYDAAMDAFNALGELCGEYEYFCDFLMSRLDRYRMRKAALLMILAAHAIDIGSGDVPTSELIDLVRVVIGEVGRHEDRQRIERLLDEMEELDKDIQTYHRGLVDFEERMEETRDSLADAAAAFAALCQDFQMPEFGTPCEICNTGDGGLTR